jgi:site-specific recombinase XerD
MDWFRLETTNLRRLMKPRTLLPILFTYLRHFEALPLFLRHGERLRRYISLLHNSHIQARNITMLQETYVGMSLYTATGARKYINSSERQRFLHAVKVEEPKVRTLCMLLAYTGCRISEALSLTAQQIQVDACVIAFHTLKKRGLFQVREVPVPRELISALVEVHGITEGGDDELWTWGRTKAWMCVKEVMVAADITGPHATPKGLRHGFGVQAVHAGVSLNLVQKWLGHAHLSTTAIYTDAVGPEEYEIAQRMWL